MTEDFNYIDLVWHECAFGEHDSFTYAVHADEQFRGYAPSWIWLEFGGPLTTVIDWMKRPGRRSRRPGRGDCPQWTQR